MSKLKKFLAYLLGVLVLLLLLLVSVPYLFKNQIKAKLLQEIDKRVDAEVNFSDVSISSLTHFPRMGVSIHDLVITGKEDFLRDTLCYAKVASVSFDYGDLFRGNKIQIRGIHLQQPFVNLRTLANGDVNYAIFPPDSSRKDSSHFDIKIDQWEIENGRFILYDRPQRSYLELSGINHSGNGDFTQEISDLKLITSVEAISYSFDGITYLDRKKLSTNLVMEMDLKDNKFTFKDHIFEINHFKFGFEGFIRFPKRGYEVDLRLLVNQTDFRNFLSLLPGFYLGDFKNMKVGGTFSLDGHIKGIYDYAANQIPTFALDLKVKKGMFKYNHLPKAMENINLDFLMSNDSGKPDQTTLDFRDFHFDIDHDPVGGRLKIIGLTDPFIDADIKSDIDLAELEKLYPIDSLTIRGNLWSDIRVKGQYSKSKKLFPLVDARIKLDSGYVKSASFPIPMEQVFIDAELVNTSGNLADTRIDLHQMTYQLEDEPFSIKGSVTNLVDYQYDLTIDGLVEFEKLTKLYPIKGDSITGTMDIDVKTSGKLSDLEARRFGALKSEGKIEIKHVRMSGVDLPQPVTIEDGVLQFTPEKILVPGISGKVGKSHFLLTGHLYDYLHLLLSTGKGIRGDMKLTCDTLDVNALSARTQSADTASSKARIVEIPKGLDFVFDASIGFVRFDNMEIDKLEGEVRIKDGVMSLKETAFTTQGAKIGINGDYDTRDMKHPMFDLVLDIDKLDINKAYAMFGTVQSAAPAAQNTDGLFSTKYSLKGELASDFSPIMETLSGKGVVTIEDAQIKGMQVFSHVGKMTGKDLLTDPRVQGIVMETEIKGGKVLMKPFSFQIGKYFTELEGSYSFKNTLNYVLKISVPPLNKVKIPFHISGTSDNPVIKLGKGHENFDFSDF